MYKRQAKDWNDNAPTEPTTEQVTSYRALMIAGPSEKGKALAEKVNAGEALTWEDVSGVNWSVANSSSPAGYIYPSLWLQENFDKNITAVSYTHLDVYKRQGPRCPRTWRCRTRRR